MANRVATERTAIGLFHRSFNIIRTLSSSAPPLSSTTAAAVDATDPKKPQKKKKKNLFEVAQFLPNWGLGYKMAKSHWRDVSYEITKVNLYKDGRHGKAWGIRHKAGSNQLPYSLKSCLHLPNCTFEPNMCMDSGFLECKLANIPMETTQSPLILASFLLSSLQPRYVPHTCGLAVADIPVKISGVHKRGWKYIPEAMKKAIYTKKAEEPQSPAQVSVA